MTGSADLRDLRELTVISAFARRASLPERVSAVIELLEAKLPGTRSAFFIRDGESLRSVAAPSLPSAYGDRFSSMPIGQHTTVPGHAAWLGQFAAITVTDSDGDWQHLVDTYSDLGIETTWAIPLKDDDRNVLGVLTVHVDSDREPNTAERVTIDWVLEVIGLALDVETFEQDRRATGERVVFLARLLGAVAQGIVAADLAGDVVYWNAAAERILGWQADEILHRPAAVALPADSRPEQRAAIEQALARGDLWSGESWMNRRDGICIPVAVTHTPVRDDAGVWSLTITSFTDISAQHAMRETLAYRNDHDALTGLANRSALLDEIVRSLHSAQRAGRLTAVLLLDLDRFKFVNDSLGHAIGDALLKLAALRLRGSVRASDMVARHGGDEFAVIMREVDGVQAAVRAAERLVELFREPFMVNHHELYATASVGIAIGSDPDKADDLIREADTAMYVAKDEGRDRARLFSLDLHAAVTERQLVESQLRHALARHELVVWYQPEFDLTTGSILAVEALLRWMHPNGQTLSAENFISVAEETGLIHEIGRWVLDIACSQGATWAIEHPDHPLTVRVNLSALELAQPDLLESVDRAVADSGIDPSRLAIEITETALLRDTPRVRESLAGIRQRGIEIALDDFGTGYASLAYLRIYPIDLIKIDRSFIGNITTDAVDARLVAGIVALAEILGVAVTAEGVERRDQADLLQQLGCGRAQGYLYSRAVPPDEISDLLARSGN